MKKTNPVIVGMLAFLMLCALWLPSTGAAQDYDAMATAQAADAQAQQAQAEAARRAAAWQATAQAAYAVATSQAQATIGALEAQATITAQVAQATAVSVSATQQALDLQEQQAQATRAALDWERAAMATQTVYQAQATSQALQIERDQAAVSNAKAVGALVKYVVWAGLVLVCLFGIIVSWRWLGVVFSDRAQADAPTWAGVDIVDVEPVPVSPAALIPPQAGWRPAYLRPKGMAND